jgi:hypothetical protein
MKNRQTSAVPVIAAILFAVVILPTLACEWGRGNQVPSVATEMIAEEVTVREVYVQLDEAGNLVEFGSPYAYGAAAEQRYILQFYDTGQLKESSGGATIYKAFTPIHITSINNESKFTEKQRGNLCPHRFPDHLTSCTN